MHRLFTIVLHFRDLLATPVTQHCDAYLTRKERHFRKPNALLLARQIRIMFATNDILPMLNFVYWLTEVGPFREEATETAKMAG
jgi:hypothetical protein